MKNNNRKWVLIVGATAGIARALVREMARCGFDLILAARDENELEILAADARIRSKAKIAITTFGTGEFVEARRDADFWHRALQICDGDLHGVILCHGVMPGARRRAARLETFARDDRSELRLVCFAP